jgi:hypothetical protein
MIPPAGEAITDYIAQPAGPFPNLPGTFEVPSGALSRDGQVLLFYAGLVELSPTTRATSSYLARWAAPGTSPPSYQIIRRLDALSGGALGGHFIQVAPVERGSSVYLFGTGNYRKSGVYLARVEASALEAGTAEELFDPATASYLTAASLSQADREGLAPLFESDGVGELSMAFVDEAGVFVALYQRELHDDGGAIVDNRVVMRFAPAAEGPWSDAVTIVDAADPAFMAQHCCADTCPGDQILHCDKAGLYGAYILPAVGVTPRQDGGTQLDVPFVVSTWDPYNVVLLSARVRIAPR